jgi:hypothetical protein
MSSRDVPLDVQREVLRWVQDEAGFAQVVSLNRAGFPVGRTMGVALAADWSVVLVQRRIHRRLGQLRRDPKLLIVWVGTPASGSTNDHPHVYDYGRLIPRVVFLQGVAEFLDPEETVRAFQAQTASNRARGWTRAPQRDEANVRAELVGIRVRPVQVRAEGFGVEAESFTWHFEGTKGGAVA